jgi:hypothetical protein
VLEASKAPGEKPGADEQHDGQRHLRGDDEPATETLVRVTGEPCPPALEGGRDASSRDVQRARDPERDAGHDGHGARERDHARIHRNVIGARQASGHERQHDP